MSFASAIRKCPLLNLESLLFHKNQIGDEGVKAFVLAVSGGSLPKLEWLALEGNVFGDGGIQALTAEVTNGSIGQLQRLSVVQSGSMNTNCVVNLVHALNLWMSFHRTAAMRGLRRACKRQGVWVT
jgi:hypothetical protein